MGDRQTVIETTTSELIHVPDCCLVFLNPNGRTKLSGYKTRPSGGAERRVVAKDKAFKSIIIPISHSYAAAASAAGLGDDVDDVGWLAMANSINEEKNTTGRNITRPATQG